MSDVERRRYRRRPCLADASIGCDGRTVVASIHDISERGCFAAVTLQCRVGQALAIELPRFGLRLNGDVVAQAGNGVHIAFTGSGLPAAEADRISMITVQELVTIGKDENAALLRHVANSVAARATSQPAGVASGQSHRFGDWYRAVNDPATLALPSFDAVAEADRAANECGRQALAAMAEGDSQTAQRRVAELRTCSEQVSRCLDQFGREYPTTVMQHDAPARTEDAA
jgi:hypothetical protein